MGKLRAAFEKGGYQIPDLLKQISLGTVSHETAGEQFAAK